MKRSVALWATAVALLLPTAALADCDNADFLLKQAYPQAQTVDGRLTVKRDYAQTIDPSAVACKVWPFRPELTLVAVPLIEASPPVEGENKGDVEILLTDTQTGTVIDRRLEKGMAFSDAIQFDGLSLDTARYDLEGDRRAFGLRTRQSGSSRVNPYEEEALWLYVLDKDHIQRRVLDGLIVERSNGENDGDCTGSSTTIARSIKLGPKLKQGYRNLEVEQTVTRETLKKGADDCQSSGQPGSSSRIELSYGDGHYRPPAGVKLRSEDGDIEKDLFSDITIDEGKP